MPKYYCEYCDVFLTHDSPSVRKGHNAGKNHVLNVRNYYAEIGQDKAQAIINEITRAYENSSAVIPPQYSGQYVPGYGPPRPFGAPYMANRPPGHPPYGNMSTGHLNRPVRPYFNGPRPPPGGEFNRPPPPGGFNRPPPPGSEFGRPPPPGSEFGRPPPGSEFNRPPPGSEFGRPPPPGSEFGRPPLPGSEFNRPPPSLQHHEQQQQQPSSSEPIKYNQLSPKYENTLSKSDHSPSPPPSHQHSPSLA